jgi:hypothetical protein
MTRYVFACVRVPIEITPEGRQITHNDNTVLTFEECTELPEKNKPDMKQLFQEYLRRTQEEKEKEIKEKEENPSESIVVLKTEIKHDTRAPLKNSTFKNRKSTSSSRYTRSA